MKNISYILLAFGMLTNSYAQAASFDCKKASSKIEKMICQSPQLGWADVRLNDTYKEVRKSLGDKQKQNALRDEQRAWLKSLGTKCADTLENYSESCLTEEFESRTNSLKSLLGYQLLSSFYKEIYPGYGLAKFIIYGNIDENSFAEKYSATRIEILLGEYKQIISNISATYSEKEMGFEFIDIDFDGYKDFRIVSFIPASAHSLPHQYWRFDNTKNQFISAPAFDELMSAEFDETSKTIKSFWRSSNAENGIDVYILENKNPVLVRKETHTWDDASNGTILTIQELVNGEMKVTSRRVLED